MQTTNNRHSLHGDPYKQYWVQFVFFFTGTAGESPTFLYLTFGIFTVYMAKGKKQKNYRCKLQSQVSKSS